MLIQNISGQEHAKRAIEVALTGNHNTIIIGTRGSGKSYFLKAVREIAREIDAFDEFDFVDNFTGKYKYLKPMIVTASPCPCGFYGHDLRPCICTNEQVNEHQNALAQHNWDIHVELSDVNWSAERGNQEEGEEIVERIRKATSIEHKLWDNTDLGDVLRRHGADAFKRYGIHPRITNEAIGLIGACSRQFCMTYSEILSSLSVAETIRQLAVTGWSRAGEHEGEKEQIKINDMAEAVQYRPKFNTGTVTSPAENAVNVLSAISETLEKVQRTLEDLAGGA